MDSEYNKLPSVALEAVPLTNGIDVTVRAAPSCPQAVQREGQFAAQRRRWL